MSDKGPGKHVIILGAGASMGSGYPNAEKLRLLLTSPHEFALFLEKRFSRDPNVHYAWCKTRIDAHANKLNHALEVFRQGNFGTVDEFCAVCGDTHAEEVRIVKDYMSFVLCCVAPEFTFEGSEYHGFIRRLFNRDRKTLRDDVAVLTFNYDPYLEYLLVKALEIRTQKPSAKLPPLPDAAVVSGLCPFGEPLAGRSGFCHLKLHGSIGLLYTQREGQTPTSTAFSKILDKPSNPAEFLMSLFASPPKTHGPVFFPWEINFENGQFSGPLGQKTGWAKAETFNDVFSDIWQRAREEVQTAKKISFVGVSIHDFLMNGLTYLFRGKPEGYWLTVANKDMDHFLQVSPRPQGGPPIKILHPTCSAARIYNTLSTLAGRPRPNYNECAVTDFSAFIATEMEPFTNY